MSKKHLTNQSFTDLNLPQPLIRGVHDAGFEYCTPIQAEALPPALAGQDVAGQAQTGTGKTAAFLIAAFAHLLGNPADEKRTIHQPRMLVLAPTRELAIQIHKVAQVLGAHTGLSLGLAYGGTGYEKQRSELGRGVDVLIGTPGRLIDYFKQKVFNLRAIQTLVLDEADRMFDLGFIRDIRYLLRAMPPPDRRLSMLFSATLSLRVNELAYEHMNNPLVVKIESERLTVDRVTEKVYFPSNDEKIGLLLGLLNVGEATRTLIFVNTKHGAELVERWLRGNEYETGVLSGNVPQRKRERLLQDFKDGKVPILVATDVAARGLHIPDVSHVINYDLPQDPEDYVHRVGRTARAGASGDAISFACETYAFSLADIEDYVGHKIPVQGMGRDLIVSPQPPVPARPSKPRGASKRSGSSTKSDTARREPSRSGRKPRRNQAQSQPHTGRQAGTAGESEARRPAGRRRRSSRETPAIG